MKKYLVSVIVSTYNSEAFMKECLDDLVRQTIFDITEIIVVDAASQQNEQAIVKEYQQRYSNIHYIRTDKRIGIYAAWNIAVKASSGQYITTFSTNDHISRDAYEILSKALDAHPEVVLVYGNTYLTGAPHESFEKHTRIGSYDWPEYSYGDLLQNCRVGPHPMWRRTVHDDVGYFDEKYAALGDYELWLRLGEKYNLLHIHEFTGLFWMDPASLSLNKEDSSREIAECREKYQRRFLKRLGPGDDDKYDDPPATGKALFKDRVNFIMNSVEADHLLRQYYVATKNEVYIHKRDLPWFFDINFVDLQWLMSCIAGMYDLIKISILEMGNVNAEPLAAIRAFVRALGDNIKTLPADLEKKVNKSRDEAPVLLLKDLLRDLSLTSGQKYEFRRNFLISEFMKQFENFGKYLFEKYHTLKGSEEQFVCSIYKLLAVITGETLGAYYLYSESLGSLTPELERVDNLLGRREGVCNN